MSRAPLVVAIKNGLMAHALRSALESDMNIERREFATDQLEIEERGEGRVPRIRGHAAVFNELSVDLGGFREQVSPGAFLEAIEKDDVRALMNHDPNRILGRNRSKTLELIEDARGLAIVIDPPDTQYSRDLVTSIKRGDISQMSFGFTVRPGGQSWEKNDDGIVIRTLKKVRLFDVSPVTFPAYAQTDVAVRALNAWQEESQRSTDEVRRRMRMRLALAERGVTG